MRVPVSWLAKSTFHFLQQASQFLDSFAFYRHRMHPYDDVNRRHFRSLLPECLTYDPPNAIAIDSSPKLALGHHDAQARKPQPIGQALDLVGPGAQILSSCKDRGKLYPFEQALATGKSKTSCQKGLHRQTVAALGASSIDYRAARACFHADPKAVCTLATSYGRLVRTFHWISLKGCAPPRCGELLEKTAYYTRLTRLLSRLC
jgi:hypothetical protein